MTDALNQGFIASQVGEALANYALADGPLLDQPTQDQDRTQDANAAASFTRDDEIWNHLFQHRNASAADKRPLAFYIVCAAVTEWVARVPGLFWLPGAAAVREVHPQQIESETGNWRTYKPRGKSQLVSGGIGTLRFPPSEDGYRMATLTAGHNASSGVPALISEEVWEYHNLGDGSIVNGSARWRDMPLKWAKLFPIMRGIPRGCLVLDNVDAVHVADRGAPILIHPFSIMEYWDGNAQLHDFVYSTADTHEDGYREQLADFFERYRKDRGREGTYLTGADIPNPIWIPTFEDPEDMRVHKAAQLRLIERRVEETVQGADIVGALIRKLSNVPDTGRLKVLSVRAGVEWRRWSKGGSIGDEAARLVDCAIQEGKQQALLQAVHYEFQS